MMEAACGSSEPYRNELLCLWSRWHGVTVKPFGWMNNQPPGINAECNLMMNQCWTCMIQPDNELGPIYFAAEIHQLAEHALNPNLARRALQFDSTNQ